MGGHGMTDGGRAAASAVKASPDLTVACEAMVRRLRRATEWQNEIADVLETLGGALTGLGSHWIIIDDLMKAGDAASQAERKRVQDYYAETLYSRLDNKETGRIIGVQQLQPGDTVGYGSAYVCDRATRVGIVACGYADGYPRHAPTGTPVLVDGRRTRTLGRVSMDMLAVDLSDLPASGFGSEVTLWGEGPRDSRLPIDEVAQAGGTIGYELMCAVAPRVPMRHA